MSSSSSRTGGGGGTRTGGRTASATDSIVSAVHSAMATATRGIASAAASTSSGGSTGTKTGASGSANSTAATGNGNNNNNSSKSLQKYMITWYPIFLWWVVAAMSGLVMLLYFSSLVRGYLRRRKAHRAAGASNADSELKKGEAVQSGRSGVSSWRNLPAAFSTAWNIVVYRWTLPTSLDRTQRINLGEGLFCAGYVVACMVFGFINNAGGINSFANRTGWLAYAQTPLIVGLAGKNNVISYLTGVGPEKLNVLHRTAGRAVLVLSLAHTFAWVDLGLNGRHAIDQPIIIWGVVAMVAFSATALLSFRWIRRLCYEFFLISHIILIFLFLLGCIMHKQSAAYWIYPSFALWGADRVARLMRMILLNRLWLSIFPSSFKTYSRATVEAISDHTLRITMKRKMSWRAGQYVYLVIPGVSRLPWEAHPFTVASAPTFPSQKANGEAKGENQLVFLVRARDGFTKRLMNRARSGGGESSVMALVDGAYGCPPDLLQYTTVVLVTGGSGISYTLSQLSHIIQYHPTSASAVKRISFIWIIRQTSHISWVAGSLNTLLCSIPSGLEVEIKVFVTTSVVMPSSLPFLASEAPEKRSPSRKDSSSSVKSNFSSDDTTGSSSVDDQLLRSPNIRVQDGRPDIPALLKEEVDASRGPVSVSVCGPTALARTVRAALTKKDLTSFGSALRGRAEVELHVETFGW